MAQTHLPPERSILSLPPLLADAGSVTIPLAGRPLEKEKPWDGIASYW